VSAILDNATLTAAEISPQMHLDQVRAVLMSLLISGGMLIPGNIPTSSLHTVRHSQPHVGPMGHPTGRTNC